jgi:acyl carrier protein
MNRKDIFNKVSEVFIDVLEDEKLVIHEDYNADDIDDWDSLTHIMLIVETEKKFNIKFLSSEITSWKDIGAMITAIESKI